MMELLPVRFESDAMENYVNLFAKCFPSSNKFNLNYLDWLYQRNPFGKAVGFDAWDGGTLAAHYVGVPMEAQIAGKTVRALLSLNTATNPSYQGRGLFTKLADLTYDAGAAEGFDAVFGVANSNSTPGFVRKLGFQLVEPLAAKVGWGSLGLDLTILRERAQFCTRWSKSSLEWRCSNPNNLVSLRDNGDHLQIYAPAIGRVLPVYAELTFSDTLKLGGSDNLLNRSLLSPLRLYLGLAPFECKISKNYIDIPKVFRPSPLNFIYKPLNSSIQRLEPGCLSFTFLDFDAY